MSVNFTRDDCPVKKDAEETVKLGGQMLKAMRKFLRKLRDCPECPYYDGCPVLADFNATFNQVILELHEEWDLK